MTTRGYEKKFVFLASTNPRGTLIENLKFKKK
jgi:hypothetical protein